MKVRFVVNPHAAAGRVQKQWTKIHSIIKQKFNKDFEVVFTERAMHAVDLTREGIQAGCNSIIAVGGDGTLNEVVNGFFQDNHLIPEDVSLGMLEIGTGGDFIRNLNFPESIEDRIDHLSRADMTKIDVGVAEFQSFNGEQIKRYFLNILDFGMGAAVVECVNRKSKRFGGKISFLSGILQTLFTYKNKEIRSKLDNGEWNTRILNNFIVANGKYFGGGLKVAPDAIIDDGIFEIVLLGDYGKMEAIFNLSKLRKGKHVTNPKVSIFRATTLEATANEPVFIDMDGEFVGKLPINVSILPGIFPILV